MFTGLVETVGEVASVVERGRSVLLGVAPDHSDFGVRIGGSVAVDGVCLTVEEVRSGVLFFTAVSETLARTTLARVRPGVGVNLERAMRLNDRLEGHIVLGHVDGVGRIASDQPVGDSVVRSIRVPAGLRPLMAPKGSVALDGISLTVVEIREDTVNVSLVPHTLARTTWQRKRPGDCVNIECDLFARYIFQHLAARRGDPNVSASHEASGDGGLSSLLDRQGF